MTVPPSSDDAGDAAGDRAAAGAPDSRAGARTPDDEPGAPLPELQALGAELGDDPRFGARVTRSIERRLLAGELTELSLTGPGRAFLTLLELPFSWFTRRPPRAPDDGSSDA